MNRHERRKAQAIARIQKRVMKRAQKNKPKFTTPTKLNPSHAQMQRDVKQQNEILREEKRRADKALAAAHQKIAELQLKLGALARAVA